MGVLAKGLGWTGWARLALGALLLACAMPAPAAERPVLREYDVKAAFLFNFAIFGEWPESAFAGKQAPFIIGVLGQDPFGRVLDDIVAGESLNGRPIVLRRFDRIEAAGGCHILFISASEKPRLQRILQYCREKPVLTVGDLSDFAEAGGMIGFVTGAQITLKVNPAALRAAGLNLNSKLLRLARVLPAEEIPLP